MQTIAPSWLWATCADTVLVSPFVDFVGPKKQGARAIGVKAALDRSLIRIGPGFGFDGLPGVRSATVLRMTRPVSRSRFGGHMRHESTGRSRTCHQPDHHQPRRDIPCADTRPTARRPRPASLP